MTSTYDAIVIGAGPAGSTAGRTLALSGAKVLILDKAKFPRDKPCGGGVTVRADRACGVDLSPVTEREIYGVRVSVDLGRRFDRTSSRLLAAMTQRSKLDSFLLENAACAGADVRDGTSVRAIEIDGATARVHANGDVYESRVLIGADGVNGVTAKALGLDTSSETGVAFDANYPLDDRLAASWSRFIAIDLHGIPGGYGWVFPKGNHLNIGVGGWQRIAPSLKHRLAAYCAYYGFDASRLSGHRGYRLPFRRHDAVVVRGPAMLAGDAASLVDPLSGEGIWAAFVSGRLAAEEAQRLVAGDVRDLRGYQRALDHVMRDETLASQRLHLILERLPGATVMALKYSDRLWRYVTEIVRGEITYADLPRELGPLRHVFNRWGDLEIRLHERGRARRVAKA